LEGFNSAGSSDDGPEEAYSRKEQVAEMREKDLLKRVTAVNQGGCQEGAVKIGRAGDARPKGRSRNLGGGGGGQRKRGRKSSRGKKESTYQVKKEASSTAKERRNKKVFFEGVKKNQE